MISLIFCQPKTCTEEHLLRAEQTFCVWFQVFLLRHSQGVEFAIDIAINFHCSYFEEKGTYHIKKCFISDKKGNLYY